MIHINLNYNGGIGGWGDGGIGGWGDEGKGV